MAKKGAVNKTKAVLEYLKAHPGAGNKEVAEALTAEGIEINAGHVSTIKTQAKRRRKARRAAVKTVVAKTGIGVAEIKAGLALLRACGSVATAKQALAAAEEIRKAV
jgi:hypothetical protein